MKTCVNIYHATNLFFNFLSLWELSLTKNRACLTKTHRNVHNVHCRCSDMHFQFSIIQIFCPTHVDGTGESEREAFRSELCVSVSMEFQWTNGWDTIVAKRKFTRGIWNAIRHVSFWNVTHGSWVTTRLRTANQVHHWRTMKAIPFLLQEKWYSFLQEWKFTRLINYWKIFYVPALFWGKCSQIVVCSISKFSADA